MFIDYAILAVLSAAMLVYAYLKRPEGQSPGGDDEGGSPRPPRPTPIDRPPTHGQSLSDRGSDRESDLETTPSREESVSVRS